jgi:hypothetical protein
MHEQEGHTQKTPARALQLTTNRLGVLLEQKHLVGPVGDDQHRAAAAPRPDRVVEMSDQRAPSCRWIRDGRLLPQQLVEAAQEFAGGPLTLDVPGRRCACPDPEHRQKVRVCSRNRRTLSGLQKVPISLAGAESPSSQFPPL